MILATVGTQLPFPRLLTALDRIAKRHGLEVIAQTCVDVPGLTRLEQHPFLTPAAFDRYAGQASVIVGHAGIGTIISADRVCRPLILFPRRASLNEHRNEHQLATAQAMRDRCGIHIAWDEAELESLITGPQLAPLQRGKSATLPRLVAELTGIVTAAVRPSRG